mgnify:CR=1 FL=1
MRYRPRYVNCPALACARRVMVKHDGTICRHIRWPGDSVCLASGQVAPPADIFRKMNGHGKFFRSVRRFS